MGNRERNSRILSVAQTHVQTAFRFTRKTFDQHMRERVEKMSWRNSWKNLFLKKELWKDDDEEEEEGVEKRNRKDLI